MKNKIICFFFIITVVIGCKKEQPTSLSIKDDINNLFNLKKYQKNFQKKVNDSVFLFEGKNKRFSIRGEYNFKKNYKTGWWKSYEINNKEKYLDVEFFKEVGEKKELLNQIIFYKDNNVDTISSKFYTRKIINNKKISYNFYFPKSLDNFYSTNLNLGILSDEKPLLYPTNFKSRKIKSGNYHYLLDISEYEYFKPLIVVGLFSEYSKNDSKNTIGVNEIFINDTIR